MSARSVEPVEEEAWETVSSPLPLLRKDLREAAKSLGLAEVRFLTDSYYAWQGFRISSGNQVAALRKSAEPHTAIMWTVDRMVSMENDIKAMLDVYTRTEPTGIGLWCRSIVGIGPVLAAGLLGHIDITRAPTAGHIWRLAGLDPTTEWIGKDKARKIVATLEPEQGRHLSDGQLTELAFVLNRKPETLLRQARFAGRDKPPLAQPTPTSTANALSRRPWNASLRTLAYKIGESFIKVQNNKNDVYGKVYAARKALEIARNERGDFAEQAAAKLQKFSIGKDTDAYVAYSAGKLPPAHIHARARRYAVKMFIAHLQEVMFFVHYGKLPPLPYPIVHIDGHTHIIGPPNANLIPGLVETRAAQARR